jgi:hypothetical protein
MAQPNVVAPNLPLAPVQYEQRFQDQLNNILRLYFNQLAAIGPLTGASLNLDVNTLPTSDNYDNLKSGDVYRDVSTNALKVKV